MRRISSFPFKLTCTAPVYYQLLLPVFFFQVSFFQEANAQVQWASKVLGVSSEYRMKAYGKEYSASQALGKPNVLPNVGSSYCAWSPSKEASDTPEWIHVAFAQPAHARQVAIAESCNAGTITKVFLYDPEGQEYLVYENSTPGPVSEEGRMLNIFFDLTPYLVSSVKIQLNTAAVNGWINIDAIGISPENIPVKAQINLAKNFKVLSIEKMPPAINSEFNEVFPVISPDGNTLYFDRKNHPENNAPGKDDIWYSQRIKGKWVDAVKMDAPLNNHDHNYICAVTPDGNTLLLGNVYKQSGKVIGGVSISHRTADGWSFPEQLVIENYQNLSKYSEFNLSNNQSVLLLAIETEATFGDRDIYVSFHKEGNNWTAPLNLGPDVNTAATELTPFLAADGKTLYFSSKGYSGYGGTDMFMTRRLDDTWTNWSEPVNLGPELNSPDWDASYTLDASGEYAYFVSVPQGSGNLDIFRCRLPAEIKPQPVALVYGKVFNSSNQSPIAAEIRYEVLPNGTFAGKASADPIAGEYKIILPLGQKYGFWAKAKGFLSENQHLDLTDSTTYVEIERDLYLTPLEKNQAITLNNVFFEQSKETLLVESFPELNRIAQTLLENLDLQVLIEGHTDIEGNPIKNMELSQRRVLVIKNYLIDKGVPEEQIQTKAYGSTRPLTRKRDDLSKKINRRVEFRVLSI